MEIIKMKKIQVLKPRYRVDECLSQIKECLDVGWTGMGFKTVELEEKWKEFTSLDNAHFLNSATSGLHLAINILKEKYKWDDKSEIITSPMTFVSTNHAIMYENLKPVFADIDKSLNLNPKSILQKINKNTKAIIFVGIAGNTTNMIEVIKIARSNNIAIILDGAHMAGSYHNSKHVGFDVDVAVFSFQAVKNMPTADSGMICFRDENDDKRCRELSWLGINKDTFARNNGGNYKWDYSVNDAGFKYHGNSIMASLGLVALKYLDEDNRYRRQISSWYTNNLKDKIEIIEHESNQTSRHLFQIVVENREKVIDYLTDNNIFPGVHYRQNTEYKPYKIEYTCENSNYYSERVLTLPIHTFLKKDDIDNISKIVLKAIDNANN
jgi:dTDP-4-amino-4,6-dideoxygalactose transaminase